MTQDPANVDPRDDLHFRLVFENAGLGIAVVGLDARPIRTNPAFRAILGYDDESLRAMRFAEFTHPDDVGIDVALFEEMLAGQRDRYQIVKRYVRKDGRIVWVRLTVTGVRVSATPAPGEPPFVHVIAMVEDIDETLRAQEIEARLVLELNERVKELTALHRASRLLDAMADGGATKELLQEFVNLLPAAFLHASLAGARLVVGPVAVSSPGHRPGQRHHLSVAIPTREAGPVGLLEVSYPDDAELGASPFLAEERSLMTSLAEMLGGTLDRIHANERLALAIASTRLGVWEWDPKTNAVSWSDELLRLAGLERGDGPLGSVPTDRESTERLVHPEDLPALNRGMSQLLADPLPRVHLLEDFRIGTVLSGWRWVSGRGRLYRDAEGRPARVLGTAVDIQERRTLEEQLRQAQKMEAIGRLAGGVAHDFNNLLTVIGTNAAYLSEAFEKDAAMDPAEIREVLAEISAASDRAARLTAQLLAFGRKSAQRLEAVEPAVLVRGVTTMLRRLLGESVALRLEIEAGLGPVRADLSQLEQVLMNLAINARDAMPSGGIVSIHVRRVVRPEGRRIAFEVRDQGVGMDAVTRARAFEPFYTTKPLGRGTGLGLSVALGIVQQSGGAIEIDSDVGRGTTVTVLLPELEGHTTPAALRPISAAPAAQTDVRGASILVVEDEPAVARLVKRTLESRGHWVLVAGDADEAEALLARLGQPRLDLLVADIRLPGRSGRALAEALVAERPDLAVIFISGYHEEGALSFLQKPFRPQALIALVDAALAERRPAPPPLS